MARLGEQAGVPAGVVNVLTTRNPGPVVNAMLSDPRVRKLSFTGSTGVGRVLLAEAAKSVVSCSMELGGNAPFLVFDDADLDAALAGAMVAKMRNAGEACTAANRFYVQEGIHDAFVKGLSERMAALKIGPGYDPATNCGPMITQAAVKKIDRLVSGAIERGGRHHDRRRAVARHGLLLPADGAGKRARRRPRLPMRKSSVRSQQSTSLPPRKTPSALPMTPNTAWQPISTAPTSRGPCGLAKAWKPACWGSTAG